MNTIRTQMALDVEAFIPVIRETYRCIPDYQRNRTPENEAMLRLQLTDATTALHKVKPFLHRR
jgi:hypothetical protein